MRISNGWHWKSFFKFPIYLITRGYHLDINPIYIDVAIKEEQGDALMIRYQYKYGLLFTYSFSPS